MQYRVSSTRSSIWHFGRTVSWTLRTKNDCLALSWDTVFHTTTVMAAKQPWSESGRLSCVERTGAQQVNRKCLCDINHFTTTTSGSCRSLTRRSLIEWSNSIGVYVWDHVFKEEDILSVGCIGRLFVIVHKLHKWSCCVGNCIISMVYFKW